MLDETTARPTEEFHRYAKDLVDMLNNKNFIKAEELLAYQEEYIKVIAYFLYYGFLPLYLPNKCSAEERFKIVLIALSSAPWMGAVSERYSSPLKNLITNNILVYDSNIKDIKHCLAINPFFTSFDSQVQNKINEYYKRALHEHEKRFILQVDLGWTLGADNLKKMIISILSETKEQVTVKLVAYHGRTWFGVDTSGGFIQDMLNKYKNLRMKILLVDSKANIVTREGSTQSEHECSSQNGMVGIRNCLSKDRKRVDIRFYGKKVEESFLRGMIIIDSNGLIYSANIVNWRFRYERGIYGKELSLHRESSLAELCNYYFDDIFNNSRPLGNSIKKLIFCIKENICIIMIILIPIATITTSFFSHSFYTILGVVQSILMAIWSVVITIFWGKFYKRR